MANTAAPKKKTFLYKGREYVCTLELAMDVIGGKWKGPLIYHLRFGAMRSSALQHSLDNISNKMFTQSVRELEADGIIKREIYPVVPPKVEYSLTKKGESLVPIVENLARWGLSLSENGEDSDLQVCDASLRKLAQHND